MTAFEIKVSLGDARLSLGRKPLAALIGVEDPWHGKPSDRYDSTLRAASSSRSEIKPRRIGM
ncbi:hypothetical protein [Rhodopila sp.]|uniref:hypothetical protein n=1 Tax=Rhodopila sp. TaxID=2480087 RepID=UPI003D108546